MPLSSVHKKVQNTTSQRRQHQYIYCHCQLGHVTSGCAILVAVCIFMLPMLEVAAEHKLLTTTHHTNPADPCGSHVTFSHSHLVLPSLNNLLPAMVLQNRAVRSNIHLSCSMSYSTICGHVSLSLGLSVPSSVNKVVGMVVTLLLLLSGDIETNPGPPGNKLTSDDFHCLLEEVYEVRAKWYTLGIQLKLSIGTLDAIKAQFQNPRDQLLEMLKTWLTTGNDPTWKNLTDALRSQTVGEIHLAGVLEAKYCNVEGKGVDRVVPNQENKTILKGTTASNDALTLQNPPGEGHKARYSGSTSPPPSEDFEPSRKKPQVDNDIESSTSPPPSEGSQRTPFGCGCGKCTFFSFIERGCPTPIPSASSFPYLNLSGLTHDQQQKLKAKLRSESQEIMIQFQKLLLATINSLIKQNISQEELVCSVMALGAFNPVFKKTHMPVFHQCFKELKAAGTIRKVFIVLNDYFSFFNYHILEHIIEELGTEDDKAKLQRYKDDFNQYATQRVFECLPEFGPVSDADHADIFVKLDSQYEDYTLAEIEGFCRQLSKILCVSSQGVLRLCRIDKGCFQLMFQVPSFVQHEIFPLSTQQEKVLADRGVIRLTCGDYQFQKDEPSPAGFDKEHQHDPGDDSGKGPSMNSDEKSTAFSEDRLDKEMEEIDYELKVQGLVETASSYKSGSGLALHVAVRLGQSEHVRFLVEKEQFNPMQRNQDGFAPIHVAAIKGDVQMFKYFITDCNCSPACPGPLGLTPLHLASYQGHLDIVKYLVSEQQIDPTCEDKYQITPLHRACAGGYQAVVEFLTSEHERYTPTNELISNLKGRWDNTPLHGAVVKGHLNIVRFFISDKNCDPNNPGCHGRTPLHIAAEFGHLHIVKYLIDEQGCNPSCLDERKYTPLHCAAMKGHINIVQFLTVEKHCDPMCRDYEHNTPLHMVARNGYIDIVKFFCTLKKYAPITAHMRNLTNKYNITPLHDAVGMGHLDIVKFFICDQKCDSNIPGGENGGPPLHCAADSGHLHIVKYLTDEQGCNPSCFDNMKQTPLHYAAKAGHMDIVKFLTVEKHCDPMCRDIYHDTPLYKAAGKGHLDIVQFLISNQNCDPNVPCWLGSNALHYAADSGQLHIVKYLIDEQGCNPSCLSQKDELTPLHCAAMKGHIDIVEFLTVEKHCDPMCRDVVQNTPLHVASQNGHIDTVKFLCTLNEYTTITKLINNLRNSLSSTPLHNAAGFGHLDIVRFFISDQKCDPNIPGGQIGLTALHCAAQRGHLHIVKYLTDEQGCNPSHLDKSKNTPLHWAAMEGHMDIVKFLTVEKHCDPRCRDFKQHTPLHLAAFGGHINIVKFLTEEKHCDPLSKDADNNNVLHIAVMFGHFEIVKFLIEKLKCPPDIIGGQHNITPLLMAQCLNHYDIAQYLQKHSAIPYIHTAIDMMKQLRLLR